MDININWHLYSMANCCCIYSAAARIIAVDHLSASATVACHLLAAYWGNGLKPMRRLEMTVVAQRERV